jgi:hypothetical protein
LEDLGGKNIFVRLKWAGKWLQTSGKPPERHALPSVVKSSFMDMTIRAG